MTATPAPRVFLASWLDKKMEWRFVYEHRYFILDGTRLSYRLEEHGAEKRFGTIISFDPWRETAKDDTSKGFRFTVWLLEGGAWTLRAATREIYDSWLHALLTVLVSSNLPSAAPSESGGGAGGGMISSRDNSSTSDAGGATPSAHLESDGMTTWARKSAAAAATGGAEREDETEGAGHRRGRAAEASREAATTHTSSDGSPLTVAAIAAAVHAGTTVSVSDAVLLSSMVEKETAWRGRWKPRYMELREGRHLVIRSSATSKSERQRYVVEAVDPSPLSSQPSWLLFTTSNGDRFWVRYGSAEESQRWYSVCRRLLHSECSWHWLPLAEDDAGRSLRLRQATSGDYTDLHLHYHAAAIVPSFQDATWCSSLFIVGGALRWCKQMFNPQARAFLPHPDPAQTTNRLCTLELGGPHVLQSCQPAPFQEGPHALVRPLPRYGASLTCVPVEVPLPVPARSVSGTSSSSPSPPPPPHPHATTTIAARVVLFGGLSGGGYQPPTTELWSVWRSPAACAPGTTMQWNRQDLPPYELPQLAFHDAVHVPWRCAGVDAGANGSGFLLVTGGLDVEFRCRAECYAVVWNDADSGAAEEPPQPSDAIRDGDTTRMEEKAFLAAPAAFAFGQLPEPRAFHRMAVVQDGTVVLVGGRGIENAAVAQPVLTLAPEAWRRAAKSWRRAETVGDGAASAATHSDAPAAPPRETWCSVSTSDEDDADMPASPWRAAHFDSAATCPSTALRPVGALPAEMGDVAVAATGRGNRVVVLGQVSQPSQEVKLFLLDLEEAAASASSNGRGRRESRGISAGQQFPPGTRRVRCHEVVLFVGAVPNRVVGVSLHVYNDYLYVIGGCGADTTKSVPHELCGPLRILLE
ncbi:hypothetical protein NESM_000341700 [Novymonas esmeraldas]|uniref:PH domain-containing protein n=1 Tax=Novymonas esmeraldas TaxID=1808958 RepID=A0AAW0EJL3_9TRYP